jgi:hypothetical protein
MVDLRCPPLLAFAAGLLLAAPAAAQIARDDNEGYGLPSDRISPGCRSLRQQGLSLPCDFYDGGERKPGDPRLPPPRSFDPSFRSTVELDPRRRPAAPRQVSKLRDVAPYLVSCWQPPRRDEWRDRGVTLAVTFRADGTLLGRPRITAGTPRAGDEVQRDLVASVLEAVERCTPLPLAGGFERAIPGRRFLIRFVSSNTKDV